MGISSAVRRLRQLTISVAAVSTLAAVLLTAGCTGTHAGPTVSDTTATASTPATDPVPSSAVAAIVHALGSGDRSRVDAVIAPAARPTAAKAAQLIQAGTHISVTGPASGRGNSATLPITLSGAAHGKWQLLLVRVNGRWLAYGTRTVGP